MNDRGGHPRKRTLDLAIAATANVHTVSLRTENTGDFTIIADLVDARTPGQLQPGGSAVDGHTVTR